MLQELFAWIYGIDEGDKCKSHQSYDEYEFAFVHFPMIMPLFACCAKLQSKMKISKYRLAFISKSCILSQYLHEQEKVLVFAM